MGSDAQELLAAAMGRTPDAKHERELWFDFGLFMVLNLFMDYLKRQANPRGMGEALLGEWEKRRKDSHQIELETMAQLGVTSPAMKMMMDSLGISPDELNTMFHKNLTSVLDKLREVVTDAEKEKEAES